MTPVFIFGLVLTAIVTAPAAAFAGGLMRRGALLSALLAALVLGGTAARAGELALLEQARAEAQALAADGNFAEARETLAPMLRRHSDVYWLALRYAYLSYKAGKLNDAETYYGRASRLEPEEEAPIEGSLAVELSGTHIEETRARGKYNSFGLAGSLGPFHGVSVTLSGYTGKKMLPIENWGLAAANTPDLYRGGWRGGLSWANQRVTVFALYGKDKLRASAAPADIDYVGTAAVLGAACRFGL